MFPMGPTLKREFPEMLNYSVDRNTQYEMRYGEKLFFPQTYFVDTSFLGMFDFPLLKGDRKTALDKQHRVDGIGPDIVRQCGPHPARQFRIFGDDTLPFYGNRHSERCARLTLIQFDALQSFNTVWSESMGNNWVTTYVELAPNTDSKRTGKIPPPTSKKHPVRDKQIRYSFPPAVKGRPCKCRRYRRR